MPGTCSTRRCSRQRKPRSASRSARRSGSSWARSSRASPFSQRGLLPYVVASQTIPILALAPMVVVGLGMSRSPAGRRRWMRVAVIAAYLTFFPVTVNTLRGLRSVDPGRRAHATRTRPASGRSSGSFASRRRCRTSSPRSRSRRRRASSAPIIGELPSSIRSGLGGGIINFNQYYTLEPENLWAANLVAAMLGISFFLAVVLVEKLVVHRAPEQPFDRRRVRSASLLRGVSKTFGQGGVTALQDIDLEVGRGEFVSLIGPSGCGKSTLLRIDRRPRPAVDRRRSRSTGSRPHRARLDRDYGIVFQAPVLYDWRTVRGERRAPARGHGWSTAAERGRAGARAAASWSGSRASSSTTRGSSRAGCSSASRSREPSSFEPGDPAHGRAVRGSRRDDPRAPERRAPEHLAGDRLDGHLRHALHLRRPSSSPRAWS